MIEIDNLTKRFGSLTAVDGVSFRVERGEILGFLGPNGAGKSTTMRMVTGYLTPTSGTVRISGHDIQSDPIEAKKRIGYLPEGAPLYAEMTPKGLLEFAADVRGLTGARREQRIREVVSLVHLDRVLDQRVDTLSKGFKRRVGLAQAILHDPEILVLDEPTDGLDPNQKHEVRELIQRMAKDKVIVLSTHILEEVDAVCTRAIIIAGGRIRFDGTPTELKERSPRHNSVRLRLAEPASDELVADLGKLGAVATVQRADDDGRELLLAPRNGAPVLEEVGALARERGLVLEGIQVEQGRLDDVFRDITGAADPAQRS